MTAPDPRGLLQSWLAQALELRQQASACLPPDGAQPAQVRESVILLRGYLDRMETLQSCATGMAGSARRYARHSADLAQDAHAAALRRQRRTGRQEDYVSAAERDASASLDTLQQQQAARQAHLLRDEAEEIVERIRSAYRWVDEARRDLRAVLGNLAWESHLER